MHHEFAGMEPEVIAAIEKARTLTSGIDGNRSEKCATVEQAFLDYVQDHPGMMAAILRNFLVRHCWRRHDYGRRQQNPAHGWDGFDGRAQCGD